jgi:hypothetical protein
LCARIGRDAGVDRVLEEGDTIELGNELRLNVVHTPVTRRAQSRLYWSNKALQLLALPFRAGATISVRFHFTLIQQLRPARLRAWKGSTSRCCVWVIRFSGPGILFHPRPFVRVNKRGTPSLEARLL